MLFIFPKNSVHNHQNYIQTKSTYIHIFPTNNTLLIDLRIVLLHAKYTINQLSNNTMFVPMNLSKPFYYKTLFNREQQHHLCTERSTQIRYKDEQYLWERRHLTLYSHDLKFKLYFPIVIIVNLLLHISHAISWR